MSLKSSIIFIFAILIVDQCSKIFIKTNFLLGEEVEIFNWFKILFIENEGMAWGTEIPGKHGKLILTIFRILAIFGIGYWLWDSCENRYSSTYLVVAISLIFAGAMGNIIDSVFYGQVFSDSHHQLAEFNTKSPYADFFHGKVVDMLYFPIWSGNLPDWFPFWGGKEFTFFNAIFNFADMAISTGVGILIVFNKKAFAIKNPYLKKKV